MASRDKTIRFWQNVKETDACWIWMGSVNRNGYGKFKMKSGVVDQAHRIAYELLRGLIPPGMKVCHSCDTPRCVAPDHLYLSSSLSA